MISFKDPMLSVIRCGSNRESSNDVPPTLLQWVINCTNYKSSFKIDFFTKLIFNFIFLGLAAAAGASASGPNGFAFESVHENFHETYQVSSN